MIAHYPFHTRILPYPTGPFTPHHYICFRSPPYVAASTFCPSWPLPLPTLHGCFRFCLHGCSHFCLHGRFRFCPPWLLLLLPLMAASTLSHCFCATTASTSPIPTTPLQSQALQALPPSSRDRQISASYRNQGKLARPTRSRSRSPARHSSGRLPPCPTSPNYQRPRSDLKQPMQDRQPFQNGAASNGLYACALCLGRFAHNVHKCKNQLLWDNKTPTFCRRNAEGRLVNAQGLQLCYDWQRPNGCSNSSKDHIHMCSRCGKLDHGAQNCPRGQEA